MESKDFILGNTTYLALACKVLCTAGTGVLLDAPTTRKRFDMFFISGKKHGVVAAIGKRL